MSALTRKTISWPRKAFHVGMISSAAVAVGFSGMERPDAFAAFAVLAIIVGGLDLLRLVSPEWNAKVQRDFSSIMRTEERDAVSAGFWFLLAALVVIALAPLKLAALGFLFLAVGDPVASWVGLRQGKTRLPGGKSLEGSLALVLTCTALGTIFLGLSGASTWAAAPLLAVAGAFAAAFAEWLPLGPVDDNFRIPTATAAALSALAAVLVTPIVSV
jgi:dolichol kinase